MAAVQRQTSMLDFFSSPADRTISTKRKRPTSPEDISRCETVFVQRNPMSPEVIIRRGKLWDGPKIPLPLQPMSINIRRNTVLEASTNSNGRPRRSRAVKSYALLTPDLDSNSEQEVGSSSQNKRRKCMKDPEGEADYEEEEQSASDVDDLQEGLKLDSEIESEASRSQIDLDGFMSDADELVTPAKGPKQSKSAARPKVKTKKTKKKTANTSESEDEEDEESSAKGLDRSLEPLSDIEAIFDDIVDKALSHDLGKALDALKGRPLRVATMCSGTEAPLLAMDMINRALEKRFKRKIEVEHIFSAEIEPFKAAYIWRNFLPRLLFRDITEFVSNDAGVDPHLGPRATTVFGSKVHVPGNVFILIVGSSCVDHSNLNTQKKNVQNGESADTFNAALEYADRCEIPIIILENVIDSKSWKKMTAALQSKGYATQPQKVDTKNFYLPQTRQRTYCVCFNIKHFSRLFEPQTSDDECPVEGMAAKWADLLMEFQRPASSALTEFLLSPDDPRYQRLTSFQDPDKEPNQVKWEACRGRHEAVRNECATGTGRPLTARWPERANRPWFKLQGERVRDSLDISYLRAAAVHDVDLHYKAVITDYSQNVDRNDRISFGTTGCLTPKGDPFLSTEMRPVTGLECLRLQGMPEDLIFTSETNENLKDLAGNAMTSTIVGPAILAALIVAAEGLTLPRTKTFDDELPEKTMIECKTTLQTFDLCTTETSSADPWQTAQKIDWVELLSDARKSAKLCVCEMQNDLCSRATNIKKCSSCGHTACLSHAGNPKHVYETTLNIDRQLPADFISKWRPLLPVILGLGDLPIDRLIGPIGTRIEQEYVTVVRTALREPFTLGNLHRDRDWTITYCSSKARLVLSLSNRPQWRLFVLPASNLPVNSQLRRILNSPIGRGESRNDNMFDVMWQWLQPSSNSQKLTIIGSNPVPSWRSTLRLTDYLAEQTWSVLAIESDEHEIAGRYTLLPDCEAAQKSLYLKDDAESSSDAVYLFLDPDPCRSADQDCFVFSRDRTPRAGRNREIIARIDREYRPWKTPSEITVNSTFTGTWSSAMRQSFDTNIKPPAYRFHDPRTAASLQSQPGSPCSDLTMLMQCDSVVASSEKRSMQSSLVDLRNAHFWQEHAWKLRDLAFLKHLHAASDITALLTKDSCYVCAPPAPNITWYLKDEMKESLTMHEDGLQAATYERNLRARPPAFVFRSDLSNNVSTLRVALSLRSLAHRAAANLPAFSNPQVTWHLNTAYIERPVKLPRFNLTDNLTDEPHPHIDLKPEVQLREDQRRSLTWMKRQECGVGFVLEEVEEALLPRIDWRLEVKATCSVDVKGGILADEPSYGKTVTCLALMDEEFQRLRLADIKKAIPSTDRVATAATLIVTPRHLCTQWRSEISKILPASDYPTNLVYVITRFEQLALLTIKDIANAKVVIVSAEVLTNERDTKYIQELAKFTAIPEPLGKVRGRPFSAWLDCATSEISRSLDALRSQGVTGFKASFEKRFESNSANERFRALVPSQRLKGKKYRENRLKENPASTLKELANASTSQFKLNKSEVKGWDERKNPLLHLFRWNRLIVDEFSYFMASSSKPANQELQVAHFASMTSLQAEKRWVLSGTPPLNDFVDVRSMAKFIGVELGTVDYTPNMMTHMNLKSLRQQMSQAEKFRSYTEAKSGRWHEQRHQLAQAFLNRFARQNDAAVNHISCIPMLAPVQIDAVHRAIYEELVQWVTSLESTRVSDILKGRSSYSGNDRDSSIIENVTSVANMAEALVLCASHQRGGSGAGPDTVGSLKQLVALRKGELDDVKRTLLGRLRDANELAERTEHYDKWKQEKPDADDETLRWIRKATTTAEKTYRSAQHTAPRLSRTETVKASKDVVLRLRECARQLTSGYRAHRYIDNIQRLIDPDQQKDRPLVCQGPSCSNQGCTITEFRILSYCGHLVCRYCLETEQDNFLECPCLGCDYLVDPSHVKSSKTFGTAEPREELSHGAKLDEVVRLIQNIPEQEQVLLFVINDVMLKRAGECLKDNKIRCVALSAGRPDEQAEKFKKDSKQKVLLLDLSSDQASGLNLTNANHVIFLAPLVANSQYLYEASMLQAIRRSRRHGQEKTVYVYRFVALETIDVDILERRELRLHRPLYEEPHTSSDSVLESSARNKPQIEAATLVQDVSRTGRPFALVPASYLAANNNHLVTGWGSQMDLDKLYDASYEDLR